MNEESVYYEKYYDYILKGIDPGSKELKAVFNIIRDLTDRRGIGNEFESTDGDIQDEIINTWIQCIKSVF